MLKGFFDGLSEHRSKRAKQSEFDHLEHTEYLYSSDYLRGLYNRTSNNGQRHALMDYMDRFDVNNESYKGYSGLYNEIDNWLHPQEDEWVKIPRSILEEYLKGDDEL